MPDQQKQRLWTIGELARRAGVQPSAIRYYEGAGILPMAPRVNGRRQYAVETLLQLRAIRVARAAGFTTREIGILFDSFREQVIPSERWNTLAQQKMSELDAGIERAEAMKQVLREGLACGCLTLDQCAMLARHAP
jgi:MerR family transcriptional regulator, redox-sensitive transcriptional activator SoxR